MTFRCLLTSHAASWAAPAKGSCCWHLPLRSCAVSWLVCCWRGFEMWHQPAEWLGTCYEKLRDSAGLPCSGCCDESCMTCTADLCGNASSQRAEPTPATQGCPSAIRSHWMRCNAHLRNEGTAPYWHADPEDQSKPANYQVASLTPELRKLSSCHHFHFEFNSGQRSAS